MVDNRTRAFRATVIKLGAFATVMVLVFVGLVAVFSNYRPGSSSDYTAVFTSASEMKSGSKVKIAGVQVGTVHSVGLTRDNDAEVSFSVDEKYRLPRSVRALIRYENLTGDRYLELKRGEGLQTPLEPGGTIPLDQTAPALDLDALLGGFRPLFKALDPAQVNQLSESIVKVFQGEAGTVQDLLAAGVAVDDALDRGAVRRHQLLGRRLDEQRREAHARLVEQHHVGAHQQDPRQRHAHLPAARQRADVAVHHLLAEAQSRQHLAGAALQRVAAELLETALHLAIAHDDVVHLVGAVRIGHGGLEFFQLGRDAAHRAGAVHHLGHGAAPRHLADVLAEVADADAAIDRHLALVGLLLAVDHAKQRSLAGPVGADEPDLLALVERRGGFDEEEVVAVLLADVVEADHGYGTSTGTGKVRRPYATSDGLRKSLLSSRPAAAAEATIA